MQLVRRMGPIWLHSAAFTSQLCIGRQHAVVKVYSDNH